MDILKLALQARTGKAISTPCDYAQIISDKLDSYIYLKREDLQPTHSFKLRGAFNHASHASQKNKTTIFLTASAGNHAQGVALAGKILGHRAVIVIPETAPKIKIDALKRLGSKIILHGDTFDVAYAHALKLAADKKYTYIHPYDDPLVIAGQGTVALEIHRQLRQPIHSMFVPVGGGGLIAGISEVMRQLRSGTKIISVEASDSACLHHALIEKKRVKLSSVGGFADGTAVRQVGALPWKLVKNHISESIIVSTDEICSAIKILFEENRSMVEPAGALALAGLIKYNNKNKVPANSHQVAIVSGANLNFHQLRYISERTQLGEKSEIILGVTIPEKPGSFLKIAKLIGKRKITEFNYRFHSNKNATVFCGLERTPHDEALMTSLQAHNFVFHELTDNEIAKTHVRYMIGGKTDIPESIFKFKFPEKPGALLQFLKKISAAKLNISLFHYRNHGSDFGRVLCGFQGDTSAKQLATLLKPMAVEEVSKDLSYKLFLTE